MGARQGGRSDRKRCERSGCAAPAPSSSASPGPGSDRFPRWRVGPGLGERQVLSSPPPLPRSGGEGGTRLAARLNEWCLPVPNGAYLQQNTVGLGSQAREEGTANRPLWCDASFGCANVDHVPSDPDIEVRNMSTGRSVAQDRQAVDIALLVAR